MTIFYGDIIDFNILTKECTPLEVGLNMGKYLLICLFIQLIEFMNLFYSNLDARFAKFQVYNVLTMADDFMVVSGMPQNIGKKN